MMCLPRHQFSRSVVVAFVGSLLLVSVTDAATDPSIDVNAADLNKGETPDGSIQALYDDKDGIFFETVEVDGENYLKMDDQSGDVPIFLRSKPNSIQSPIVTVRLQGMEMTEGGDGDFKLQLGTGPMRSKENEVAVGFALNDGRFHGTPRYAVGELIDVVVVANNTDDSIVYGDGYNLKGQSADVWIDDERVIQSVKTYNKKYPVGQNLDVAEVRTHSSGKQAFLVKRFSVFDQAVSPSEIND